MAKFKGEGVVLEEELFDGGRVGGETRSDPAPFSRGEIDD